MSDGDEGFGSRTGNGHPNKSQAGSKNPLAFHLGGLQNLLKLRTTYKFNERLSGLIGADLNVQQQSAFPVATLQYEVRLSSASIDGKAINLGALSFEKSVQVIAKGRHWGALQATTKGLAFKKTLRLQKKDFSCEITPKAGYTFQGTVTNTHGSVGALILEMLPWSQRGQKLHTAVTQAGAAEAAIGC